LIIDRLYKEYLVTYKSAFKLVWLIYIARIYHIVVKSGSSKFFIIFNLGFFNAIR